MQDSMSLGNDRYLQADGWVDAPDGWIRAL
jgi:hypothetical protein